MARRKSIYSLPKLKLKPKTALAISTFGSFFLALVTLASFAAPTSFLSFWRNYLFTNLGTTAVLTPIVLVLSGLVLHKVKWKIGQMNVLVGLITIMVALMGLLGAVSAKVGGELGTFIWSQLVEILSAPFSAVVLIGVLGIGLVVMLQASFDQIVGFFGALFGITKTVGSVAGKGVGALGKANQFIPKVGEMKLRGIDEPVAPKVVAKQPVKEAIMAETLVQNVAGQSKVWRYPPLSLLSDKGGAPADRGDVKKYASVIERMLESFGIQARVAEVNGGPAVTQYALDIAAGTKITKIANLQHDIALSLATRTGTVRIEAPIPGKSLVGIEVPNASLEVVMLKTVVASDEMKKHKSKLAVTLGKDTGSNPIIVDIDKMPHMLIAGTTGSGKSVLMHALLTSLLFRNSPDELKLILIDPKRVEMANYNDIPHLLTPVIVEPEKILSALKWATAEMDRRYKLFQQVGVRNIQSYNEMSGFQALPYIVIFIDELADLMMFAPVEVEDAITRLAQLARAVGIHLVIATQRPSVDVITGLMKANIPCRIAFNVSSMIDSRVIIDGPGAEKLLGRGDMLYMPPDASKPMRIQGVYVTDQEIRDLVSYLKSQGVDPAYADEIVNQKVTVKGKAIGGGADDDGDKDPLFDEAVKTVCQYDRASASLLQRRLKVGYARAARIIDELEMAGVIGAGEGSKPREVLVRNANEFLNGGTSGGEDDPMGNPQPQQY
jgi:S-DNA-T family DNA segregation ATPase FtsK/SpoIIIE